VFRRDVSERRFSQGFRRLLRLPELCRDESGELSSAVSVYFSIAFSPHASSDCPHPARNYIRVLSGGADQRQSRRDRKMDFPEKTLAQWPGCVVIWCNVQRNRRP